MTQTTASFSRAQATIEVSTDGSTWTAADGAITTMDLSGGEQHTGQTNTLSGQAPVVTNANKYTATEITCEALYTEESSELWDTINTAYRSADQRIYFRFAPAGDTFGNALYTCARDDNSAIPVPITVALPPNSDANSGDAAMFSFGLMTPKLAESTVTT